MNIPASPVRCSIYRTIPPAYALPVPSMAGNIRECRRAADITQEQLASRLGVRQNVVSKWEKGRARPAISALPALAWALGVSVDRLLQGLHPQYDASRDLSRHTGTERSPLLSGGPGETAAAYREQIDDLRQQVERHERFRKQAEDAARLLARAVAAFYKGASTGSAQRRSGRTHRKTG